MKAKYIVLKIAAIIIAVGINSCSDFLETTPKTEFSETSVFGDPVLVETFINQIYFRLDEPLTDGRNTSNLVDEAHYRGNAGSLDFNRCLSTQDYLAGVGVRRYRSWADLYKTIRFCNIFFEKVDEVPFNDNITDGKTLKDRMTGEVHFLRAYLYFSLINTYGGVPLIEEVYALDSEFEKARNTWQQSVDFVVSECDKAAALLPIENSGVNFGRATKGAALALKSRVLLYAASDLYNTVVFSDYANQDLIRYTSISDNDRRTRWEAARQAAKAVIDMSKYSLHKAVPAASDSVAVNITEIFLSKNTGEDIFFKFFTPAMAQNWTLYTSPNGYFGWGTNAPLGNMVDAFEMRDGTKFDWNNPKHAAKPYSYREPRFYANILYNEASWRERPEGSKPYDPVNKMQTGTWEEWSASENKMVERFGVDTRKGAIEDWNGSYTGYYCRKNLDPTVLPAVTKGTTTWRWFRYAEILLNYAEACMELGDDAEARTYINMVRKRAGLPDLTESGSALRQRYRNERRIELCFEDHRFYDVRRWVIGQEAYCPVTQAIIVYKLQLDHTTAAIPEVKHVVWETRSWNNKGYFLPLLRDEVNKNPLLINNPGY